MGMPLGINRGIALNNTGGGAWSPARLLSGASQLAYYDPSDLDTLFQDSAGTTPVTADGQSVGRILDKSGYGNHLIQSTAGSRPLYKTSGGLHWLQFDGTDDFLVSAASVNPGSVDKVQVFAGVRKLSDAAAGEIVGLSTAPGGLNGTFFLRAPSSAAPNYQFRSRGTLANGSIYTSALVAAPVTNVLTGIGDISAPNEVLRVNGVAVASSTLTQGTGNYLAYPLYIGRMGGILLPFNGNLYSLILRFSAANLDAAVIDQAEAWTAGKCGVTL